MSASPARGDRESRMTQDDVNLAEWTNSDNWNYGFYRSTRDDRVWVPKRTGGAGTTINFGHRNSGWAALGLMLVPLGLLLALIVSRLAR